jgi:putative transposase
LKFGITVLDCTCLGRAETIGRPVGNRKFLDGIERKTRRVLKPAKRGPKPAGDD